MKFRILINAKHPAVISDFFKQTSQYFDCLSTSECLDDLANHFRLFRPEAYVCFCEGAACGPLMTQMRALKNSQDFNTVPIVVIGDDTACNMLEKLPQKPDLLIRMPATPDKMIAEIVNLIRAKKSSGQPAPQPAAEKPAPKPIPITPKKEEPAAAQETETNEKPAAAPSEEDNEKKTSKNTILVIDDDRSILRLIKSAAGDFFNVTTMLNGDLLDKFFENKTVDLILLDYEMPGENGPQVFKRLRAMPNVQNTPIVFLTGVSDREKIKEVLSLKPQGYVLKPINMEKLFSTIYGLLR